MSSEADRKITRQKDTKAIVILRKDSREVARTVSKRSGVGMTALCNKIKHNFGGMIAKKTVLLNHDRMGFEIKALILIGVIKNHKVLVRNFLSTSLYINSLYRVNSGYDYAAEMIFKDDNHMDTFIKDLKDAFNISVMDVVTVLETVEREAFMDNFVKMNQLQSGEKGMSITDCPDCGMPMNVGKHLSCSRCKKKYEILPGREVKL